MLSSLKQIKPSNSVQLIVLLIFSSNLLVFITNSDFLSYLDELLLVLFMLPFFLFSRITVYQRNIFLVFIYFILASVIVNIISYKIIFQALIHLKFFIFLFLLNKFLTYNMLLKIIKYLMIFTLIGIVTNLIFQSSFNAFFDQDVDIRSGFLRLVGFQLSSNLLGITTVLFFIYILFFKEISSFHVLILTSLFALILFIIGSRTSFLGLFVSLFCWSTTQKINAKLVIYLLASLITPILFYVFSDADLILRTIGNFQLLDSGNSSGYIRGIMIINSFQLFYDYFPFGSGASTFGSSMSEGSIVYRQLGLDSIKFFEDMTGIYDSNWASIIGELGFIGVLLFLYLLRTSYFYFASKYYRLKMAVLSIFIIIILSGFTMPVFMHSYLSMLFSLFIVFFKKYSDESSYS